MPIAVGALATFVLHSIALAVPEFWTLACCSCGLSGAPVGFLPAILARRQDPTIGPAQGFAVSFISVGIGALVVVFVTMVLQGWEVPPESFQALRESLEEWNRERPLDQKLTEAEIEETIEFTRNFAQYVPLINSGMIIVVGGLTGLISVALMGRSAPPPPPA